MNHFFQNIMDRPLSHKIGFWVLSLIFITFIFWQYVYSDMIKQEEELQSSLEKLSTEISHERRLARDLAKVRTEVKQLDLKLKIVLKELPDKREIPDLLDSISNLAKEAGLDVLLFKPMPESYKDFYAEVPVAVTVEGTFHQVATFFDEVGRLPRIVNINQLAYKDPVITEEKVSIKSECIATTFRYLEESERISATPEAEGRKRRRK